MPTVANSAGGGGEAGFGRFHEFPSDHPVPCVLGRGSLGR